jgi:hypothetical protein
MLEFFSSFTLSLSKIDLTFKIITGSKFNSNLSQI